MAARGQRLGRRPRRCPGLTRARSARGVRALGGDGRLFAHPSRRGAARAAGRPCRLSRAWLELRHPAPAPLGQPPVRSILLARGAAGRARPRAAPVHLDQNGLPIHGILAASPHWRLVGRTPGDDRAVVAARLDYGAHEELLAAFPFPHELAPAGRARGRHAHDRDDAAADRRRAGAGVVRMASLSRAPGRAARGLARRAAGAKRALLDERGIPTGATERVDDRPAPLGERTYDDLFAGSSEPAVFALEGGGRRIELEFGRATARAGLRAGRRASRPVHLLRADDSADGRAGERRRPALRAARRQLQASFGYACAPG